MTVTPADLTILEAGAALRDGRLTAAALVDSHLDRIARRDAELHAFASVMAGRARADAARADEELGQGIDHGPLHGIPVGIKDVIDIAGLPTGAGSRLREGHIADANATVVDRLIAGGAVILGKLTTYELATVGPDFETPVPPARNPWSFDRITGGSSSGCAAAVAGGLVRTTIGTDTAGSLRGPASYCGVVGLKPTLELVPTAGILPLAHSLDHAGPISATVTEAALTLDALAGLSGGTSALRDIDRGIEGLRIGYARDWFATDPGTDRHVLALVDDAASALSLIGARIGEITLPPYSGFADATAAILNAESFALHRADLESRPDSFSPMSRKSLLTGAGLTPADVDAARRAGAQLTEKLDAVFETIDALITVTTLSPALALSAFEGGRTVWTPMRTMAFNLTGNPVLAVPAGFIDGLPVGIQIVGRRGDEATILRIGHAFERATDHAALRPYATEPAEPGLAA